VSLLALLAWGVVVALDLASIGQVMLSRPFVAGTVAGGILGDWSAGLAVGLVLELFALDVLPVGAARYPDYGPAAVVAAAAAAGAPGLLGTGVALAVGLLVAWAGEASITVVRRLNSADARRHAAALDAGDPSAVTGLQVRGMARDAARGLVLTAGGLVLAWAARSWPLVSVRGAVVLTAVIVAGGLSSAARGAWRLAGHGVNAAWVGVGLAAGLAWVMR
jgi:PTS system mannose-specific IIC component